MPIKRFIPTVIKKPLWWLFKAPQHEAGLFTYGIEISGILGLAFDKLFSKKSNLEPVTICVSNKNRSEALVEFLIGSILKAKRSELIRLSVFDCGSEDVSQLQQRLHNVLGERLIFETQDIPFARSMSINKAVKNASTNLIFIADADISLPDDIVEKVNFYARRNRVWFPVCNAYTGREEKELQWYTEGKGLTACLKQDFEAIGGYDEKFTTWGLEDTDLWFRFWKNKFFCYRTKEKELIHHWHKSIEGALKEW